MGSPWLWARVKASTAQAPRPAASQNAGEGRAPVLSAEITAVAIGRAPITTAEWAVLEVCNASAVSSEKPIAQPIATTARAHQSCRTGKPDRKSSSPAPAISAAMTPRRPVAVQGPKPSSAQTVAGKLKENISTPRAASGAPCERDGAVATEWIALFCVVMNDDSASRALAETLATEFEHEPVGAQLPSQRALVRRFGASATTVARALQLLAQRGVVESRPGSGTFRASSPAVQPAADTSWQEASLEITENLAGASRRRLASTALVDMLSAPGPEVTNLSGGYLHPQLQPLKLLSAALARAGRRTEAWSPPHAGGLPELRDWFSADIGGGLGRHDLLISGGGQSALATITRALTQPGDPLVIEAPTYPGTIAAGLAAGLRPVPVPMDEQGLRPEALDEALARSGARVVVVQPLFQNPTGATMTVERQDEILRIAGRHGAFVVEDDFGRYMAHADSPPLPPAMITRDPLGSVVHVRSLTKVASPNLRVAAVAARGPVMARLRAAFLIDAMAVPAALQLTALEVVTGPGWRRATTALAQELGARRDATARALAGVLGPDCLSYVPRGGYHLWAALPSHEDADRYAASALAHGVALTSGTAYHATGPALPHVRISYVATASLADAVSGIERLPRTEVP